MKRMISFVMVLCMLLVPTFPVSAGDDDAAALEKAIQSVRKVIDIPESYTEFSHYSYTNETTDDSGTVWNFYWYDPDTDDSISATVDWEGNIINYYKYTDDGNEQGLAKVTRAQGQTTAMAFLKKVYPGIASQMKEINRESNLSYTYEHYYQFGLYVNDIPAPFVNVYISINKYNGEVRSFGGLTEGFTMPSFPETTGEIGKTAAKAAFLEKLGFDLGYNSTFDYDTQTLKIFPTYQLANSGDYIDAMTGEPVSVYYYGGIYYGMGAKDEYSMAGDMGGMSELSEEEIAEIITVRSLLTKSQAIAKIKAQAPATSSISYTADYANLNEKYTEPGVYLWSISFPEAYATVDAATGELLSFNHYEDSSTGHQNLTYDKCRAIAEAYLAKTMPEKYAKTAFNDESADYALYEEQPDEYSFFFNRVENGYNFDNNGMTVSVNRKTGHIQYFNCEWYGTAVFPTIENAISEEEMLNVLDKEATYGLQYQKVNEEGEVRLVYGFIENLPCYMYDPATGNGLDWNGDLYEADVRPEYTDISGHFCEKAVTVLLENNYYLEGDLFKPNQKITQLSFFRYLYSNDFTYLDDEELYDYLEDLEIIKEGESAPASILTRQDAAKFMVRFLGLGIAGEHPEIFNASFTDKVADNYKGYAALVNGLGIMKGDLKGRFNGTSQMTNAEAAVAIYQLLQVR